MTLTDGNNMGQKMHFKLVELTPVPGTDHFSKASLTEKAILGLHFPDLQRYWLSTCGYHMGSDGIKWLKIARLKPFLFCTFTSLQIQF